MYLVETERTDLEIKYDQGQMVVHLDEFLSMKNLTKFKKLVRLIRSSYTPDEEQKILNYIERFNEQYEIEQDELEKKMTGYAQKIRFAEKNVTVSVAIRSQFKKNSADWKKCSKTVKEQREELQELKNCYSGTKRKFTNNSRLKVFFDKCIEFCQG